MRRAKAMRDTPTQLPIRRCFSGRRRKATPKQERPRVRKMLQCWPGDSAKVEAMRSALRAMSRAGLPAHGEPIAPPCSATMSHRPRARVPPSLLEMSGPIGLRGLIPCCGRTPPLDFQLQSRLLLQAMSAPTTRFLRIPDFWRSKLDPALR